MSYAYHRRKAYRLRKESNIACIKLKEKNLTLVRELQNTKFNLSLIQNENEQLRDENQSLMIQLSELRSSLNENLTNQKLSERNLTFPKPQSLYKKKRVSFLPNVIHEEDEPTEKQIKKSRKSILKLKVDNIPEEEKLDQINEQNFIIANESEKSISIEEDQISSSDDEMISRRDSIYPTNLKKRRKSILKVPISKIEVNDNQNPCPFEESSETFDGDENIDQENVSFDNIINSSNIKEDDDSLEDTCKNSISPKEDKIHTVFERRKPITLSSEADFTMDKLSDKIEESIHINKQEMSSEMSSKEENLNHDQNSESNKENELPKQENKLPKDTLKLFENYVSPPRRQRRKKEAVNYKLPSLNTKLRSNEVKVAKPKKKRNVKPKTKTKQRIEPDIKLSITQEIKLSTSQIDSSLYEKMV